VLNAAARLIFHLKRSDHITDALVSLHWVRGPGAHTIQGRRVGLFIFILFIYLFDQKTIITVTKVPVHELDKKAIKLALTIAHKHSRSLHTQHIEIQSISHLN